MNKLFALVVLILAVLQVCAGQTSCFAVGKGNVSYPGYTLMSLNDITQTGSTQTAFIQEYNQNGGFPDMGESGISYCCLMVQEGYLYQGPDEWWNPYYSDGARECESELQSPVLLGTNFQFWPTLNESVISLATVTQEGCGVAGDSYALYNKCGTPSGNTTCCIYYSCDEMDGATFCQKSGYSCPKIADFFLVTNVTVDDCGKCAPGLAPLDISMIEDQVHATIIKDDEEPPHRTGPNRT